jgi:3-hydroxymyristoyl/3-hydroxydecanoyl-(acyl carrier protein) dehydratase
MDIPIDAWFLRENPSGTIPTALVMEIALQPCGFLSAYLDTYAAVPHREYFFRNLDGKLRRVEPVNLRGKTIRTRARLIQHVVGGGTVIQKFAFSLFCADKIVFDGEATFGYFAAETMLNQVGLDGGERLIPQMHTDQALARAARPLDLIRLQQRGGLRLPSGRWHLLDEVRSARGAGRHDGGYLYARRAVNPSDWFYPFHFANDPVMPGSLGVEAIVEAMEAYALANGQPGTRFDTLAAQPVEWRYRGQILPTNRVMELEVHLRPQIGPVLQGDASLWVDGLRIYEINNLTVSLTG